jgi:hypothetical protein
MFAAGNVLNYNHHMKTSIASILIVLIPSVTAFSQARLTNITASLETIGETSVAESFVNNQKSEKIFSSIRPVTIRYKEVPWLLMVVDIPDEKQVVHFTKEQMETIASIVEAKDGKTHYLEVTNFFDVYSGKEKAEVNQEFLNSMESAIKRRRWYKNNAVFMVSSTSVGDQHVIRFKLPFANNARICRHVKAIHNLKEGYYETTPAAFLKLLTSDVPDSFNVSAN